jgi:hypothetical protein
MKLEHVGESFTDTHPIITLLGDGRTIFIVLAITIIASIIGIITPIKVLYNNKKMKKVFEVISTVVILSVIILVIGTLSYIKIGATPQHLTYESKAKVVNVSPIKKGGVQNVTFEHKGQTYQVSQPTKVAQNINKGDKVQLKCHIKHYLKSHTKYNDYQNKDGSFKKEIDIQNHMDGLKIERK